MGAAVSFIFFAASAERHWLLCWVAFLTAPLFVFHLFRRRRDAVRGVHSGRGRRLAGGGLFEDAACCFSNLFCSQSKPLPQIGLRPDLAKFILNGDISESAANSANCVLHSTG